MTEREALQRIVRWIERENDPKDLRLRDIHDLAVKALEPDKCPTCHGTDREGGTVATAGPDSFGNYDTEDCPDDFHGEPAALCNGSPGKPGTVYDDASSRTVLRPERKPCPGCPRCRPCGMCNGKGERPDVGEHRRPIKPCPDCDGTGVEPTIPERVEKMRAAGDAVSAHAGAAADKLRGEPPTGERVRRAILHDDGRWEWLNGGGYYLGGMAMVEVVPAAALQAAERERDEASSRAAAAAAHASRWNVKHNEQKERAEAAERRAEEAERELEALPRLPEPDRSSAIALAIQRNHQRLLAQRDQEYRKAIAHYRARAEAAEARLREVEAGLARIAEHERITDPAVAPENRAKFLDGDDARHMREVARSLLPSQDGGE